MRLLLATLLLSSTGIAPDFTLVKTRASASQIRGAAVGAAGELLTWGERLERWQLPSLQRATLARFTTSEGGCLVHLNPGGQPGIAAPTSAGLALFEAPHWRRTIIDAEADTFECLDAQLLGHRGLLVIHRGMQVRLYERPAQPAARWPYREIYSFYTASHQGGLIVHDVDADGLPDILCGNYWIRSPAEFHLPWALHAINTWSEEPHSATARLAISGGQLLWLESRASPARAALFERPADSRTLWPPRMLGTFHHPRAAAYWQGTSGQGSAFLLGEDNGANSRLLAFPPGSNEGRQLELGHPVRHLLPTASGFAAVGPHRVALFRHRP